LIRYKDTEEICMNPRKSGQLNIEIFTNYE
jgi:hypothetical protein